MRDSELLKRLKSGEADAFREVVELHRDRVINTAYGFVRNEEDAEDIAQEVFIEVYRSIASFRGKAKLSTWIYRITVTKSLDLIRRRDRMKRFDRLKGVFGSAKPAEDVSSLVEAGPEPSLERKERLTVLQRAVDSLPQNQRIAITLSKYRGLSYRETAEVMGTSLAAVESLVHRAMTNLRKKLYAYYRKNI